MPSGGSVRISIRAIAPCSAISLCPAKAMRTASSMWRGHLGSPRAPPGRLLVAGLVAGPRLAGPVRATTVGHCRPLTLADQRCDRLGHLHAITPSGPRSSRPAGWPQRKIRSGRGVAIDASEDTTTSWSNLCTSCARRSPGLHRRSQSPEIFIADQERCACCGDRSSALVQASRASCCVVRSRSRGSNSPLRRTGVRKVTRLSGALVDARPHFGQTHVSAPPSRWVSVKSSEKPSS